MLSNPRREDDDAVSGGATRLDHVAIGVSDVSAVVPVVVGELGGREHDAGPGPGFVFWQWSFAGGGTLEVLSPDGPPGGFLHRFLDARGPGVHHVTFKLPDIREAMDRAKRLGYEVVGFDDGSPGWIEAFLRPKQAQGIVVQLTESHPELSGEDWTPQPFPPAPSDVPPPVELVGLRLAARSEARARRQWEELLGGTCLARKRDLLFRWPDSPLRIAVTVDAALPEGPLALEIASDRNLRLPEGPHPALGLPVACVEE